MVEPASTRSADDSSEPDEVSERKGSQPRSPCARRGRRCHFRVEMAIGIAQGCRDQEVGGPLDSSTNADYAKCGRANPRGALQTANFAMERIGRIYATTGTVGRVGLHKTAVASRVAQ